MAMRLGGVLKGASRVCASNTVRSVTIRQFASAALRSKDVASQEDISNLRHAPRPRRSSDNCPRKTRY